MSEIKININIKLDNSYFDGIGGGARAFGLIIVTLKEKIKDEICSILNSHTKPKFGGAKIMEPNGNSCGIIDFEYHPDGYKKEEPDEH